MSGDVSDKIRPYFISNGVSHSPCCSRGLHGSDCLYGTSELESFPAYLFLNIDDHYIYFFLVGSENLKIFMIQLLLWGLYIYVFIRLHCLVVILSFYFLFVALKHISFLTSSVTISLQFL